MKAIIQDVLIFILVVVVAITIGHLTGRGWISGVIIGGFLLYVVIRKGFKSDQRDIIHVPTNTYMRYVGGHCPDYWKYIGTEGGKDICQNNYKLKTTDDKICYTDKETHEKRFERVDRWPLKDGSSALTERCRWQRKCGKRSGQYASWSGLKCN